MRNKILERGEQRGFITVRVRRLAGAPTVMTAPQKALHPAWPAYTIASHLNTTAPHLEDAIEHVEILPSPHLLWRAPARNPCKLF
jgi:hypothetical protein